MADISITTRDENNIAHLTSNTIVSLKYVDVSASRFSNPDAGYYGYAADGFYREAGVAVSSPSTLQSPKSSWATEGEHTTATADRGLEDAFPKRIFVITTAVEVVILDADDLAVWIRFTLASGATHADYYCLGGASTVLVDADYDEGVLSVVVSDPTVTQMNGLVVVDFRRDKMFFSGAAANAALSSKSISDRNATGVWTVSPSSLTGMGQKNSQINNVSILTEQNQSYVATSHDDGITLLRFQPGSSGYATLPTSRTTQDFEQSYTSVAYNAVDDFDGDSETPTFYAANYTEWPSDNIRSGDILQIGANSYRIESVGTTQLTLSDEIPVSTSATGDYKILRRVDRVLFRTRSSLFYSNGEGLVVQQQDQTWQSTNNNMTPFDNPNYQASTEGSTSVRAMAVRGDALFVATDAGVFSVSLTDTSTGLPSELLYSASSGTGSYKILADNLSTALAVDTDSGHLLIATYDGASSSEVLEVDVDNFHQKVRTTAGTVEVNALIGYTNPSGPPTVSV